MKSDYKIRDLSYLRDSNIKEKEFYESKDTLDKSIKTLKNYFHVDRLDTIYDFCSGHSFSCYYALSRNLAKYAVSIDIITHINTMRLSSYYPQFLQRVQYKSENIFLKYYHIKQNSVVLSIHPCRELAFRVSEIAIQNRSPCIIVPCCNGGTTCKSWLDSFGELSEYQRYSMKIAQFLNNKGYDITIRNIRTDATPKNIIIIGTPNDNQ